MRHSKTHLAPETLLGETLKHKCSLITNSLNSVWLKKVTGDADDRRTDKRLFNSQFLHMNELTVTFF
jgi:hypothetical protein